jgi:hypothetical protein
MGIERLCKNVFSEEYKAMLYSQAKKDKSRLEINAEFVSAGAKISK